MQTNQAPVRPNDSPLPQRLRLSPADRVVNRIPCWRPACRVRFAGYRTVALTFSGQAVAFCHRRIHDDLSYRADVWRYGERIA